MEQKVSWIYNNVIIGPLAQWIERGATDSEVEGSSPSGPANSW